MDDRPRQRIARNQAFIEAIQREAEGLPEGSERQKRYAALTLCQIARGDALTKLISADILLDDARRAVDDVTAPAVDFGRIPTPDFARQQDEALDLQRRQERAARRVLAKEISPWLRAWAKVSRWLRG